MVIGMTSSRFVPSLTPEINNAHRELHGALLDSEILGDVYLAMTGGQVMMSLVTNQVESSESETENVSLERISLPQNALKVIRADASELAAHHQRLAEIEKMSGKTLWN